MQNNIHTLNFLLMAYISMPYHTHAMDFPRKRLRKECDVLTVARDRYEDNEFIAKRIRFIQDQLALGASPHIEDQDGYPITSISLDQNMQKMFAAYGNHAAEQLTKVRNNTAKACATLPACPFITTDLSGQSPPSPLSVRLALLSIKPEGLCQLRQMTYTSSPLFGAKNHPIKSAQNSTLMPSCQCAISNPHTGYSHS